MTVRVEATRHIFELNAAGAREVQAYLSRLWGLVGARFTLYANNRGRGAKAGADVSLSGVRPLPQDACGKPLTQTINPARYS